MSFLSYSIKPILCGDLKELCVSTVSMKPEPGVDYLNLSLTLETGEKATVA